MRGPLFAAGEETEAEPVAVEEAAPVVEDKVSAATYVFGAPGEFRRDMALMGTTPRRLALYGSLGVGIAVVGDLFGATSAALSSAPPAVQAAARSARLDTYYMMGPLKRYVDDEYGFEVRYPKTWLGDQAVYVSRATARAGVAPGGYESLLTSDSLRRTARAPAAIAAFGPPGGTFVENLSVFRSTLPSGFSLRGTLGPPRAAAQRLLDEAIAPPSSGKTAVLLDATERPDGFYEFEYTLQLPPRQGGTPGYVLHNLAVAAVTTAGELLTLTVLCPEADWPDREARFRDVASSFALAQRVAAAGRGR